MLSTKTKNLSIALMRFLLLPLLLDFERFRNLDCNFLSTQWTILSSEPVPSKLLSMRFKRLKLSISKSHNFLFDF